MDTLLSCPGQNRLNQHWMGSNFCDLEPLFKMLASISSGQRTEWRARITWTRVQVCLARKTKTNWSGLAYLKNRFGEVHPLDYSVTMLEWKNVLKCLKRFSWLPLNQAGIFFWQPHFICQMTERKGSEPRTVGCRSATEPLEPDSD